MKINEVEEALGISKANIRFYEKQGLLTPARGGNGYREYGQADVERLQQIIIYRKLGLTVEETGKILNGELDLQEAMGGNILRLEEQIEQLNGALDLSKQIVREQALALDVPRYWDLIHRKEAEGETFADVVEQYWTDVLLPTIMARFRIEKGTSLKKAVPWILLVNTVWALMRTFIWKEPLVESLLYWPCVLLAVAAINFPIFWLSARHPKAGSIAAQILLWLCIGVLALVFGFVAYSLCREFFIFIFG